VAVEENEIRAAHVPCREIVAGGKTKIAVIGRATGQISSGRFLAEEHPLRGVPKRRQAFTRSQTSGVDLRVPVHTRIDGVGVAGSLANVVGRADVYLRAFGVGEETAFGDVILGRGAEYAVVNPTTGAINAGCAIGRAGQAFIIILDVLLDGQAELLEVAHASSAPRVLARPAKDREEKRCEENNYRYDDEYLNQGKTLAALRGAL